MILRRKRKREHEREYVELAESYRQRINEAEKRARKAEALFNDLVRGAEAFKHYDGTVSVRIDFEPYFVREPGMNHEVARIVAGRVCDVIFRNTDDWRRHALTGEVIDLRETA